MTINIYSFVITFRTDDVDNIECIQKKTVAIIVFALLVYY